MWELCHYDDINEKLLTCLNHGVAANGERDSEVVSRASREIQAFAKKA